MAPCSSRQGGLNTRHLIRRSDAQTHAQPHTKSLWPRQQTTTPSSGNNISMIVGFSVVAFVMIAVSLFCFMRNRKRKARDKTKYQQAPLSDPSDTRRPNTSSVFNSLGTSVPPTSTVVNRATSIRSILTLPAYQPHASENERVLGVAGERDGVDVILELPTEAELENMRENEMESLYQIRLARRLEIQEREERRRLRREARSNNDPVALRNLRQQRQAANERDLVAALREEHDRLKAQRQRAAPSVAYADVGIARHDGTRVRGTSMESERVGLLSDAASISASVLSPRRTRDRSGSALSVDSDTVGLMGRPRADSALTSQVLFSQETNGSNSPRTSLSPTTSHTAAEPSSSDPSPPEYEDIPLTTTITTHSVNTTASVIPTEPPPTYEGSRIPSSNTSRTSSPGAQPQGPASVASASSSPTASNSALVQEPTSATPYADVETASTNTSQSGALPFRLPSLNLGAMPRMSTQRTLAGLESSATPEVPSNQRSLDTTDNS
ncbi:uncharacterized protein BROUX77_005485 [Berkeleyomyces rouxiae]|uniref:uncharacterized protein n=1 Tax=Berkeleyomyces rouxiae TaxID=2035830 RepID=UPI003B77C88A